MVGKTHTLRGEPINVRCRYLRLSITTELAPTQIVGQDEHDIRFAGRLGFIANCVIEQKSEGKRDEDSCVE